MKTPLPLHLSFSFRAITKYRQAIAYGVFGVGLLFGLLMLQGQIWYSDDHLHTLLEVMATVLAATVGIMALVRYYTKKDFTTLLIGSGFLGQRKDGSQFPIEIRA